MGVYLASEGIQGGVGCRLQIHTQLLQVIANLRIVGRRRPLYTFIDASYPLV